MGKRLRTELGGKKDYTCAICMDEIKTRQKCSVLGCKHVFHKECAKEWFTNQCEKPTCPCCRSDIRDKPSFKNQLLKENISKRDENVAQTRAWKRLMA